MAIKSDAPGLIWRTRKDGQRVAYWAARADLVKRGYEPKSVRLHYDINDPLEAAALRSRCERLHSEMLAWESQGDRKSDPGIYDGSLKILLRLYETDPNSPYHELQPVTQQTYSKVMQLLMQKVGEVYVDQLTGADIRRWFRALSEPKEIGGPPRLGWANMTLSIFKAVLSYGVNQGYPDCKNLREQLAVARFRHAPARTTYVTHQQIAAFREAAHRLGRPSAALWVTLQFELGLRRRDVIGTWVNDSTGTDGLRNWQDGLTWTHIDGDGVLRKLVSKTAMSTARWAIHRVDDYPDLVAELDRIPLERRVGPLVINETTGLPYTTPQCRRYFRIIARAAGIPDAVWNMDVRAGAVTEAYEGGATTEGAMALAAHTQPSTSRRYLRNTLEQTSKVAKLRIESRKPKL